MRRHNKYYYSRYITCTNTKSVCTAAPCIIRGYANDSNIGAGQAKPRIQKPANTTKQSNDGTKQDHDRGREK